MSTRQSLHPCTTVKDARFLDSRFLDSNWPPTTALSASGCIDEQLGLYEKQARSTVQKPQQNTII
jgi:hypothetical protein